jgi:hypothetical protein
MQDIWFWLWLWLLNFPLTYQSTKANKQRENQAIAEFKEITGANVADSTRFIKKYKNLETVSYSFKSQGRVSS